MYTVFHMLWDQYKKGVVIAAVTTFVIPLENKTNGRESVEDKGLTPPSFPVLSTLFSPFSLWEKGPGRSFWFGRFIKGCWPGLGANPWGTCWCSAYEHSITTANVDENKDQCLALEKRPGWPNRRTGIWAVRIILSQLLPHLRCQENYGKGRPDCQC